MTKPVEKAVIAFSAGFCYDDVSNWHWLTTSTMPIFPAAVALTLLIECLGIIKVNQIKKYPKAIIVIGLSNFASFCLPYLKIVWDFYISFGSDYNGRSPFAAALEFTPFYMIGLAYLIITLLVEVPIVCFLLKKEVKNTKKLLVSIVAINIFTTALIAVVERLLCVGSW